MSGIICWIFYHWPFQFYSLHSCDGKTSSTENQEKNVSRPNRDLWWIWPKERLRSCLLQLHQTRGGPRMDFKILRNLLRETIDRGNLRNRHHQVIQKKIMVSLGLLKSGKVVLRRTVDRGNLRKLLGMRCNKFALIMKNLFPREMRNP